VLLLTACGAAVGTPAVTVTDARMPQPAGPNGAAYMTLTNAGDGDDRLVAVETDVAGEAQIHESTLDGGVMSMQQVDGVDLPAGDTVSLEPGGLHVMLLDVRGDLAVGDTVPLTLSFTTTGEQTVTVEVVPLVGGDGATEHSAGDHPATHAPSDD
jgi:hypothetical protein